MTEDMRRDLIERRSKPKTGALNALKANVAATRAELADLASFIAMVEPQWRTTWAAECQIVVDEQNFLNHHRAQLQDLQADHEAMSKMLANIDQYASLKTGGGPGGGADGIGPSRLRAFTPRAPSPADGLGSERPFLDEVAAVQVDGLKRLRAIESAERQRQKDKANAGPENGLMSEIVEGRKLKKTGPSDALLCKLTVAGGVEEVERIVEVNRLRSQKSDAALRANAASSLADLPPIPQTPVDLR